jgi:DNA-binding HxlR family transcriptional regulator
VRRTERRSDCPISFALEAFGDSWSLLVIRDLMFRGKTTYTEFLCSEEGIATNILASRLRHLEARGLVRRRGSGRSTAYALTAKGFDLLPALVEIVRWSAKYDPRTAADPGFVRRARTNRAGLLAELRARLRRAHSIDAPSCDRGQCR